MTHNYKPSNFWVSGPRRIVVFRGQVWLDTGMRNARGWIVLSSVLCDGRGLVVKTVKKVLEVLD